MKFVDLGTSIITLDNLITAEPFNSASMGPSIKLEYSNVKTAKLVGFESMEKANEAFKKLVEEMKKNGIIG